MESILQYAQANLIDPIQVPVQTSATATKFQILEVIENFRGKAVNVRVRLADSEGNLFGPLIPLTVWRGAEYEAVLPWTDEKLVAKVAELLKTNAQQGEVVVPLE